MRPTISLTACDFLVSRAGADADFALKLTYIIREIGLTARIQDDDSVVGDDLPSLLESLHSTTTHTIGIYSQNALGSPFVRAEWTARLKEISKGHQLLLFKIDATPVEVLYTNCVYCDVSSLATDNDRLRLIRTQLEQWKEARFLALKRPRDQIATRALEELLWSMRLGKLNAEKWTSRRKRGGATQNHIRAVEEMLANVQDSMANQNLSTLLLSTFESLDASTPTSSRHLRLGTLKECKTFAKQALPLLGPSNKEPQRRPGFIRYANKSLANCDPFAPAAQRRRAGYPVDFELACRAVTKTNQEAYQHALDDFLGSPINVLTHRLAKTVETMEAFEELVNSLHQPKGRLAELRRALVLSFDGVALLVSLSRNLSAQLANPPRSTLDRIAKYRRMMMGFGISMITTSRLALDNLLLEADELNDPNRSKQQPSH